MSWYVTATQEFLKELKEIKQTRASIIDKIKKLDSFLSTNWVNHTIGNLFDIYPLKEGYFRIKFVPYRIIIFVDQEKKKVVFKKIFKRKGRSDYKKFT